MVDRKRRLERWQADGVPLVVASALFMHLMDTAALATALPTIARAFGRETVDVHLVLSIYVVTIAALVPASAWLSARFGIKRVFVLSMIVFMVGSMACALAQSVPQLVAARILQGMGGATMTPVGRSLIVHSVPRSRLVDAMTLYTIPAIIAPLVGPPLAGVILATASWRWIFLINLPVCLVGVVAVLLLVPRIEEQPPERFDLWGFALLFIGMGLVSVFMTSGVQSAGDGFGKVLVAAGLFMIWLAYRQHVKRSAAPILDPVLLSGDALQVSLWAGFFQRMVVGAIPFLLPLLLQEALGMTPLQASRIMVASAVGGMAARFVVPPIIRRANMRAVMVASVTAASLGTAAVALFGPETPAWIMMGLLAGLGLIRGGYFIPGNAIAYVDVEPKGVGQATVLFTMVQQIGLSFGISVSAVMLDLTQGDALTPRVEDFAPVFSGLGILSALSLLWLRRLPRDIGAELRDPG